MYRSHVLICGGTGCTSSGSQKVREALKEEIKKQIAENCKKNLIPYACPVEYEFKDEFPMTRIGKIDFRALEKEAQGLKEEKPQEET